MDLALRTDVGALFEEKSAKYGLEDITYGSFTANFGFRHKFCAADVVYACMALMEQHLDSNSGKLLFLLLSSSKTHLKIKASINPKLSP
jgi:cell division control protein 45